MCVEKRFALVRSEGRAALEQQADDVNVAAPHSPVQRRVAVPRARHLDVGAGLQEQIDDRAVATRSGQVKSGDPIPRLSADIRAALQQQRYDVAASSQGGVVQRHVTILGHGLERGALV
eukprot:1263083-Prymnesium_polylepis.1